MLRADASVTGRSIVRALCHQLCSCCEPSDSLEVGSSFYHDKRESDGVDSLTSSGLELRYQAKAWRLWAELDFGWLEPLEGDRILQVGWYLQPSYEFANGLTPYFRMERIDPSTDVASDHGYDFVAGINYEVSGGFMIKVENNYFKGASASSLAVFPGASYNEIKAAVVLGF